MTISNCHETMPGLLGVFICDSISALDSAVDSAVDYVADALADSPAAATVRQSFLDLHRSYGTGNFILTTSLAAGGAVVLWNHPATALALTVLSTAGIAFGNDNLRTLSSIAFSTLIAASLITKQPTQPKTPQT